VEKNKRKKNEGRADNKNRIKHLEGYRDSKEEPPIPRFSKPCQEKTPARAYKPFKKCK
jgi:hypothetical protein